MKLFNRVFRLVWGGDVDRALRPVLAVSLAGSIAGATAYPFMGIWAIKHLGAPQGSLALSYLIGRRPMILIGWGFNAAVPLLLLAVGSHVYLGLALLVAMPVFGSLGNAADQAMVADLVAPARHEAAYASVRVASNLGVTIGPVIGGILLIGGHWSHLWLGTLVLAAIAYWIAFRYIPRTGAYAPAGPPQRGSFSVILHDGPFLFFMLSSVFATMTYIATETLLPISATTTHHLAPAAWGFLMILNPLLVTVLQLRLTRWTRGIPPSVKLGLAMPMMGVPFVLLNVDGSAPVIAFVIVVFVVGEMLWVPTSQAVVAALAPPDIRGAYMGAFGGTWSVGWALTPFLGLQVRHAYGDATMWSCVAVVGVLAGIIGFAAARGHDAEAAAVASPA
jgi:predicted MFS family arabinose efflux permease